MKLKILLSIFILVLGARDAEGAVTLFDGEAPVSFNTPKWSRRPVTEIVSYKEQGRTDTWKENVLRNQARMKIPLELKSGNHTVTIKALDSHIILDQLMLDSKPQRKYYVIPTRL